MSFERPTVGLILVTRRQRFEHRRDSGHNRSLAGVSRRDSGISKEHLIEIRGSSQKRRFSSHKSRFL